MMKTFFKAGLATLAVVALSQVPEPANAKGFKKHGGHKPAMGAFKPAVPAPGYRCYFRADAGYSFSDDDFDGDYNGHTNNNSFDDGFLLETGVGCGTANNHGFRGEIVFGYRDERDVSASMPHSPVTPAPLLTTDIESYTLMANVYYDIGQYGKFVPYVGAGIGFAYHEMDDVFCTIQVANFCTPTAAQAGDEDLSFVWSIMAGFGYAVHERMMLDFGYRYIDLGDMESERADSSFAVNPFFKVDDMEAHEIKAGFRYRFDVAGW